MRMLIDLEQAQELYRNECGENPISFKEWMKQNEDNYEVGE